MDAQRIAIHRLLDHLPPEWSTDLLAHIQRQVLSSGRKIVVLDDDPTGTQTVHGIPVLTEWSKEALQKELVEDHTAFYILTNSRSVPLAEAREINNQIGTNLRKASRHTGRKFVVVSRSDSTLRGHFPGEVETLSRALGQKFDAWLIIPFFLEGGRYTINDVHYVAEGEWLIPAGETEFARDVAFGYHASNLRDWVKEKAQGRIARQDVASISIDDIRKGGPERVTSLLRALYNGSVCVINAASYRDLEVFTQGLLAAEASGKGFLYRTAASFVRVRAGLFPRPLLDRSELNMPSKGSGLIIVGSHVPKTSKQLEEILAHPEIIDIEIKAQALVDDTRRRDEIKRVVELAERALPGDSDLVIYTSRKLITVDDPEENLSIGNRISQGLVTVIKEISTKPQYIIVKGGITSSDIATQGLNVKRALVLGQILPGVPVWRLGPESRHPGIPYIVFPGNVGGPEALAEVVRILTLREPSCNR